MFGTTNNRNYFCRLFNRICTDFFDHIQFIVNHNFRLNYSLEKFRMKHKIGHEKDIRLFYAYDCISTICEKMTK